MSDPIETVVRRVAEGLKPCPFCGGSPRTDKWIGPVHRPTGAG